MSSIGVGVVVGGNALAVTTATLNRSVSSTITSGDAPWYITPSALAWSLITICTDSDRALVVRSRSPNHTLPARSCQNLASSVSRTLLISVSSDVGVGSMALAWICAVPGSMLIDPDEWVVGQDGRHPGPGHLRRPSGLRGLVVGSHRRLAEMVFQSETFAICPRRPRCHQWTWTRSTPGL